MDNTNWVQQLMGELDRARRSLLGDGHGDRSDKKVFALPFGDIIIYMKLARLYVAGVYPPETGYTCEGAVTITRNEVVCLMKDSRGRQAQVTLHIEKVSQYGYSVETVQVGDNPSAKPNKRYFTEK